MERKYSNNRALLIPWLHPLCIARQKVSKREEENEFMWSEKKKIKTGVKPLQTGLCNGVLFEGCGARG